MQEANSAGLGHHWAVSQGKTKKQQQNHRSREKRLGLKSSQKHETASAKHAVNLFTMYFNHVTDQSTVTYTTC